MSDVSSTQRCNLNLPKGGREREEERGHVGRGHDMHAATGKTDIATSLCSVVVVHPSCLFVSWFPCFIYLWGSSESRCRRMHVSG